MSTVENNKVVFAEPPADFDWEALESSGDRSTAARAKVEKAYEDTLSSITEKEVLMGKVVGLNKKEAVINIGYKSEGVVPLSEFRYKPDLAVGDQVEVYIEKQEDKTGQMIISHKTARMHNAWGKVNGAMESGEIITGHVKCTPRAASSWTCSGWRPSCRAARSMLSPFATTTSTWARTWNSRW
jgi:small subunit ribosomal protein S1